MKILPEYYRACSNIKFGDALIPSIQLLSMQKPKDKHGYYYCEHEIDIIQDKHNG